VSDESLRWPVKRLKAWRRDTLFTAANRLSGQAERPY
jgi:hypothetical protein